MILQLAINLCSNCPQEETSKIPETARKISYKKLISEAMD